MKNLQKPNWLSSLLNVNQQEKLCLYIEQLGHFNKNFSLFSKNQSLDFCWEMALDSLTAGRLCLKNFRDKNIEIADIGSGNGMPGILWALLKSSYTFLLFEPNKKKAQFLEYCIWKMDLQNVKVKNIKVQEHDKKIIYAVSKAFLPLEQRLSLTENLFLRGGVYYHLYSLKWKQEWKGLPKTLQRRWKLTMQNYSYPPFLSERVLLKAQKI